MDASQVEQRSQEWFDARLGKVTASRIRQVLAKPRKKGETESTTRRNYMSQLAIEILTGKSADESYQSPWMDRGIKLEPEARTEYELRTNETVLTAGFIAHARIPRAGCSPDAFVGSSGLAQFKCPILAVHYDYIKAGKLNKVPAEYEAQVQFELSCTGREWSDFVSYNNQYPAKQQLVIIRAPRNEALIREIDSEVIAFNQEVDEMVADLGGTA